MIFICKRTYLEKHNTTDIKKNKIDIPTAEANRNTPIRNEI